MTRRIPHLHIVVAVTFFVLAGFAGVTAFALGWTNDELTKGAIIGAWLSMGTGAVSFWLGSSSGGKASNDTATGKANDPVHVEPQEPKI